MKAIQKQLEFKETQKEASRISQNYTQFLTWAQGYSCLRAISSQILCSDFPNYTFHLILREQRSPWVHQGTTTWTATF